MKKGDLVRTNARGMRVKAWRGVIINVFPRHDGCEMDAMLIKVYSIDGLISTYSNLFEVVEQNFSTENTIPQ